MFFTAHQVCRRSIGLIRPVVTIPKGPSPGRPPARIRGRTFCSSITAQRHSILFEYRACIRENLGTSSGDFPRRNRRIETLERESVFVKWLIVEFVDSKNKNALIAITCLLVIAGSGSWI